MNTETDMSPVGKKRRWIWGTVITLAGLYVIWDIWNELTNPELWEYFAERPAAMWTVLVVLALVAIAILIVVLRGWSEYKLSPKIPAAAEVTVGCIFAGFGVFHFVLAYRFWSLGSTSGGTHARALERPENLFWVSLLVGTITILVGGFMCVTGVRALRRTE